MAYTRGGKAGKGITIKSGEPLPKKYRTKKKIPTGRGTGPKWSTPAREVRIGDGTFGNLIQFILGDNEKDVWIDVPEHRSKRITRQEEKNKLRLQTLDAMRQASNRISVLGGEHAKDTAQQLVPTDFERESGINQLALAQRQAYKNIPGLETKPENVVNMSEENAATEVMNTAPIVESPKLGGTSAQDMRGGSPLEGRPAVDVTRPPADKAAPPQMGSAGLMPNQQIIGLGETATARSPEEYTRENMEKRRREAEAAQNINNQRNLSVENRETPVGQAVTTPIINPEMSGGHDIYKGLVHGGKVKTKRKKRLYKGGKVTSYNY